MIVKMIVLVEVLVVPMPALVTVEVPMVVTATLPLHDLDDPVVVIFFVKYDKDL
jgi:hypothetical protein